MHFSATSTAQVKSDISILQNARQANQCKSAKIIIQFASSVAQRGRKLWKSFNSSNNNSCQAQLRLITLSACWDQCFAEASSQSASGPVCFYFWPGRAHMLRWWRWCTVGTPALYSHVQSRAVYSVYTTHRHTPPQLVWRHGLGETTVTTVHR